MITKYLTDHGNKKYRGVFKADVHAGQNRHQRVCPGTSRRRIFVMIRIKWCGFAGVSQIHPYEAIREMAGKTLRGRMDAVVCYNDQTAHSFVIRAIQEEGMRIRRCFGDRL